MKLRIGIAIIASLAMAAGIARAQGTNIDSFLVVQEGDVAKGSAFARGYVNSKVPKCIRHRTVDLRAVNKGGPAAIIDEAKTSRNGGFFMFGEVPKGFAAVSVKLFKEELSPSKTCKGDVVLVDFIN